MKLLDTSVRVSKRSKRKGRKYSPGGTEVEPGDPGGEADTSAVSRCVDDASNVPKKLREASEQVRERSEQRIEQDSPKRAQSGRAEPSREAGMMDDSQSHQERPRSVSDERVDRTNAPYRRNGLGGHLGEPEASRGVEGVRDRGTVVNGAEHDGVCPRSDGNTRGVVPNPPCREVEPGHHIGEPKASRDVESDWDRWSDVEGDRIGGRQCRKDGATSGAHRDSKRVKRRPPAPEEARQQRRYRQCIKNVPRSSMAPSKHPRHPIELPNPPRRRGRLKSHPRKIRRTKIKESTHRIVRPRRGQIRRIKRT